MTYYPTLAEDLARAKEILAKGKAEPFMIGEQLQLPDGGTIDGVDLFAAYKLLESFVAIIEAGKIEKLEDAATALGQQWKETAAERDRLRADVEELRLDQRMLAHTIRNMVVALGDADEDWEGTVADGVDRINANVELMQVYIRALADDRKRLRGDIGTMRDAMTKLTAELKELRHAAGR